MRIADVTLRLLRRSRVRVSAAVAVACSTLALGIAIVLFSLPVKDGSMATLTALLNGCLTCLACVAAPAAVLTLVTWISAVTARKTVGELDVGPDGVSIELDRGRRLIPYEAVLEGMAAPEGDRVSLRLAWGDVLHVEGLRHHTEADALLDAVAAGSPERALDLGVRRATRVRTVAALAAVPLCAVAIVAVTALDSPIAVVATAALLGVCWTMFLMRWGAARRLVVGHDGVALEGALGQSFIPYRRIIAVWPSPGGLLLELDDARKIAVNMLSSKRRELTLSARRRDRLIARLETEIAAPRSDNAELYGAAQLERGGRTIAAWRASLRELMSRPTAGYRAAALDPEHLLRILETRAIAPERRLGAALALSGTEDEAHRRRLRVFIDNSASDALRCALEKAAVDELDEDVLGGALREMDRG